MGLKRVNSMLRTNDLTERQLENSKLNFKEIEEGATVLKSAPRRLIFEVTNRCNYKCIMCGRNFDDFNFSDLDFSVIKQFEPLYNVIEEVTLFGWGESMLNPQFDQIIEYLGTFPHLRKFLLSNASQPKKLMEYVDKGLIDILSISMDGAKAETLERIRVGAKMSRIEETVKGVMKKAKDGRPYVNLVFLLFNSNIHELPEMVRICSDWGVPELKVIYLTAFDNTLADETMWRNDGTYLEHFAKAQEEADRLGVNLRLPDEIGKCSAGDEPHKPCDTMWKDLFISCDLDIRPCMSTDDHLTNLSEHKIESLEDFFAMWNSEPFTAFRGAVNDERKMSKACRFCYQCSYANWNKKYAHIAMDFHAPFSGDKE
ncbi:radical SAM protein [Pseudodesulfovibrio sp. zrk46]|uniref:radical SAM protein n=1 Tax=Pseudodesulfovibrio sp. zrk46 TaxID=2725288 RepID=UPI001448C555|nr:radical SAM protein [Pseudodesulfovibrio sp. zrk46]QJB55741.1 radical SAM protein [Pseudodesulfovibrio sp. zrk46]